MISQNIVQYTCTYSVLIAASFAYNNNNNNLICIAPECQRLQSSGIVKHMITVIWRKAKSPSHRHGSVLFARWRQCAPPSSSWFSGPPDWTAQTASLSPAVFCTTHGRESTLEWAAHLHLKIAPPHGGSEYPSNRWFLRPTRVHIPNGISIGSAVFFRLTIVTC